MDPSDGPPPKKSLLDVDDDGGGGGRGSSSGSGGYPTGVAPYSSPTGVSPYGFLPLDVWRDAVAEHLPAWELGQLSRTRRIMNDLLERHRRRREAEAFERVYAAWGHPNLHRSIGPRARMANVVIDMGADVAIGSRALAHAMVTNPDFRSLVGLEVRSLRPIPNSVMPAVLTGMRNLTSLDALTLDRCVNATDMMQLAPVLASSLTKVTELSVSGCPMDTPCMTTVATALRSLTNLEELTLEDCRIGPSEAVVLCSALRTLTTLAYLGLTHNPIDGRAVTDGVAHANTSGGYALAACLRSLPGLETLNLTNTGLYRASMGEILYALNWHTSLRDLRVWSQLDLHHTEIPHLCNVISNARNLERVEFRASPRSPKAIESLIDAIRYRDLATPRFAHLSVLHFNAWAFDREDVQRLMDELRLHTPTARIVNTL